MPSRARLRRLHDANDEMFASLDLEHRLRSAVKSARELVPADAAAVFLPNSEGDALVIRAHDGLSESYVTRQRLPLEEIQAQFRAAGEHVAVDLPGGSLGDRALIAAEGLAKLLSIPLFFENKLMGALAIYTKDASRSFTPEDIELGDGVVIGWPNGRYETNPRAREILGVPQFETLAELRAAIDVRDILTGEAIPAGVYPLDRALKGEKSRGEVMVRRPDSGERRELEVSAAPVHGPKGEVVAGVMTLHDITDLLASEREREQFLSIVSHELRTPLTPLKALAQLVRSRMRRAQQQGTELDMESLDRNLAAIERQVDRMNGLVNDLLSVSRAEKGSLRMEHVSYDLAVVLRDVVQRYIDATAEEGRHSFTIDGPANLPAHGDQSRVEQLLMNLVGNAVKYSPSGGQIRVALASADRSAEIAISDEGLGIPADDIAKLGHPFVRGAGRAGTFAGMGVGLYVARVVAEAHAGSLALESDGDGKGTTVRVKLPL
jgi:signal transduction histidine kinase